VAAVEVVVVAVKVLDLEVGQAMEAEAEGEEEEEVVVGVGVEDPALAQVMVAGLVMGRDMEEGKTKCRFLFFDQH
jgi:uncharacterized protein (DUF736 family)